MLKLYGNPLSSPTNKVRFLLNELKTPYEFNVINLAAGEQKTPEFLKVNPIGKVPAIDDNGFTLCESNAILRYIAAKHNSPLYPQDIKERAAVDQWIDFASAHIAVATSKIFFNTYIYRLLKGATQDERSLQEGKEWLKGYLPIIDTQLTKNAYIAGKQLTLADICVLAALDVAEVIQVDLSAYAHLNKWRKNLMAQKFYQDCHSSYDAMFKQIMAAHAPAGAGA